MPIAEFPLDGAGAATVLVEVDEPSDRGLERVARLEDGLLRAKQTLESALASLKPVAQAVANTLRDLSPDEAEVEMGFKLTAESGVILAKAAGETHLAVKLTWKRQTAPA